MSSIDSTDVLEREEHPEATVIRVCVRRIIDEEQLVAVRDALYRQAEQGSGHLILDLSAVDYLSSASLGWLITLRKRLMQRGRSFQAPCRRRGLFAFYPDAAAALESVRRGETDPLLLCGVSENIMEIFQVC
jgi:anti-anti-sigma factor